MINKRKLQQTKDLQEFVAMENDMIMSWQNYKEHLNCMRLCAWNARESEDEEEHNFYVGLIKDHKYDMIEQLNWLDSKERYAMLEEKAQSDFVKSVFRMKRGDK